MHPIESNQINTKVASNLFSNSLIVFQTLEGLSDSFNKLETNHTFIQEALRAKALKEQEKERKDFYDKQKEGMKDNRAKYREKVSLDL